MTKTEGLTLEEKAMMVIEAICMEIGDETNKTISTIYRIAHTANTPDCRKNHPGWTKEIDKMFEEFLKGGVL